MPSLDPTALAEKILHLLEDKKITASLRRGARAYAEQKLDLRDYLAKFRATTEDVAGRPLHTKKAQPLFEKSGAKTFVCLNPWRRNQHGPN